MTLKESICEAAEALNLRLEGRKPEIGIILGSGLGPLAEQVEDAVYIPFGEIPHMKRSTATSHVGRFVCGNLAGKCVVVMQGRIHGYEGYTPQEVAFPVWVMHAIGVQTLVTTNAAGAINESFNVGDFCIMNFSMKDAYDPDLRELALQIAKREEITVHEGVYLGLLGPSFETPAEIRAFRAWGADTVAMSVCEEVIAARHVGMRVFGMSLCSNMACGIEGASPSDEEVFEVAMRRVPDFCRLIIELVREI